MFSLKSFFNFLSRNKLYTVINIFGFVASLTFVLLIGLYIEDQFNVDDQPKADRIYRLDTESDCTWAAKIADDLKNRYPEIEATLRLAGSDLNVKVNNGTPISENIMFADSTLFAMFDYQFVAGEKGQPLNAKNDIVLTKTYAYKTFGNENPIGKTIEIQEEPFVVTAVIEDIENSIIRNSGIIIRFDNIDRLKGANYLTTYNSCNFPILVLLKPNASLESKYEEMAENFKTYFWRYQKGFANEVSLTPLKECYWSSFTHFTFKSNSKSFVAILIVCAVLVLIFAVINYINLSVAQTGFRAKEAATRRLLGGTKWQLFVSFIVESTLLCFFAMSGAVIGVYCLIDWFCNVLQVELTMADLLTVGNVAIMLATVVVLGLISGVIPAYAITKFKPIQVVRGDFRRRSKMVYNKVLIAIQYFITIVLVACSLTVYRQTNFMLNADMGFDKEQVLDISNNIGLKADGLPSVLKSVPGVKEVSLSQGVPSGGWNNASFDHEGENYSFSCFMGDSLFMPMLGIEILYRTGVDAPNAVWINESAAKHLNFTKESSKMPFWNTEGLPVKGVVKDFHFNSMHENIDDMLIGNLKGNQISGSYAWNILVKISSDDLAGTVKAIGKAYADFSGTEMVEPEFLDDHVQSWYKKQKQTLSIVGMLSVLAIIIATLGILAMGTYFIRQRKTEIAVRKVFGSTNAGIFFKLISQFVGLIVIAFVVAIPIVYFAMSWWLEDFAYKINLSWDIFAIALLVAFTIALSTISVIAYKAMNENPSNALKKNN